METANRRDVFKAGLGLAVSPARRRRVGPTCTKLWRERRSYASAFPVMTKQRVAGLGSYSGRAIGLLRKGTKPVHRGAAVPKIDKIVIEQLHRFAGQRPSRESFYTSRGPESGGPPQLSAKTSQGRKPCSNIRPTIAKSCEVRNLDPKLATSSTDYWPV